MAMWALSLLLTCSLVASSMADSLAPVGILAPAPAPVPISVNVTAILQGAGQFNTFLSLLEETVSDQMFENQANNTRTGITIFAPTDKAFASLPRGFNLNKLSAQHKTNIVRYHALSAFYPLGSLQKFSGSVASTLAGYNFNVTDSEGAVSISTGLVQCPIISTLYDTNPCAIFAIGKVLLPEEIFGLPAPAPSPDLLVAPESSLPSLSPGKSETGASGSPGGQSSHASSSQQASLALMVVVMSVWGLYLRSWQLC